jgi:nicotinate-nucleotide adenylyltransferase
MKIGIYGGTFDPIHLGHMAAARVAAGQLELDKLLLIPAGMPPHKELSKASADAGHRLAMTELAADRLGAHIPVEVLDLELKRSGKSYTSDTLRLLHTLYPEDELWLLMGTDMFLSLHQWHEPEVICALAGICAFARDKADSEAAFAAQQKNLEAHYRARVQIVPLREPVEISSTQLRQQLSEGKRPEQLDESVYGYILRHQLYGTHADLKKLDWADLRACSYSMIRAKRIPHVRGCEEEAVRLARRWGADEDAARAAAILHDCTKYLTLEEHLALCDKYGMELDEMERTAVKLLHSKTGSLIARYEYGMPEPVCQAICWHTTGKPDMTTLEKILYIADYMEPTRDFDGVEQLRELVVQDLDAAVELGLAMSVEELTDRGVPVHTNTQGALRFLRKENNNG